jgi:uncharacterized protein (DUF1015 family)
MSLIRPFAALRPDPARAAEVLAPPYDVVSREEARARIEGRPFDFLRVSRPDAELPDEVDPHSDVAYARAAENLRRITESGALRREERPRYYVYRIVSGDHVQTGLAAGASLAAYAAGRVRRHELTRPDKEDDRVRQIEAVGAQTGPVFCAFRDEPVVRSSYEDSLEGDPEISVDLDGVLHQLWTVTDGAQIARITGAFESLDALYIADGHHRAAAGSRAGRTDALLTVSFPDTQVRILDYNRVVRDLGGLSPEAFRGRLETAFTVTRADGAVIPEAPGTFGLRTADGWWRLALRDTGEADPVARLDVARLARHVLEPVLDIRDPRRDPRIDFVGGSRGTDELDRRVDSGEWAAAFRLYPTSLAELFAVADAGEMMPPKSTWFDPKLADGMVSLVLED